MEKKEKKTAAAQGESSAQELLRQLRARYDTEEDTPDDVFDEKTYASDEGADDDQGRDEELTRRIMEMFATSGRQDVEETNEAEEIPPEVLLPSDEEEIEVEVEAEQEIEQEIEAEAESAAPISEKMLDEMSEENVDELADLPEEETSQDTDAAPVDQAHEEMPKADDDTIPDDYEGEVFDTTLPDIDDTLEDDEPTLAESIILSAQREREAATDKVDAEEQTDEGAEDDEDAFENHPDTKEDAPAVTEEPESGAAFSEDAPKEAAAAVQGDTPPAPVGAMQESDTAQDPPLHAAALPISESGAGDLPPQSDGQDTTDATVVQQEIGASTKAAPTAVGEASNGAPQQEQPQAPVALREDEVLLDEYDELPARPVPEEERQEAAAPPAPKSAPEQRDTENRPKQVTPRPSPLDAALSAQRKKHESEGGRHSAELRAAETLSEEDMVLLLRLGYENELRNKQPPESLHRAQRESVPPVRTDRQKFHIAYGWRESEGQEVLKDAQIKENYRKNATGMVWRLLLSAVFAVMLLALDLSPLYTALLPERWAALAVHPSAHLLALQLLVLCAIPSASRLVYGLRQLLRLTPEPCSVVLPVLLCNLAYDVIMALQPTSYVLLNFPTALLLLMTVIADGWDLRRERIAFSVVSTGESKVVLSETKPRKKKVVRGGRIVKIINDDADRTHYSVDRAERVDGYFRRTNEPTVRYRAILPLLALQLLLSLGVTGICTLKTGITPDALTVLMLSLQLSAPAACLVYYAYALLIACRRLQGKGATIIGQSTVDDMAQSKLLIFSDTEMLQAKSSTEITVKGSGDPKRYVRYARRLFYALGGTLGKINTSDLSEDRMDGLVEILRVYPEGVEARLDGRVHVLAGSSDFMMKNNLRVPHTNAEMLARRNEESSILYLAFGGQIRLGYEINYRIHGSFEQMVSTLAQGRTAVAVRSYDPNITEEYLVASRAKKKVPVRVIKPVRHEVRSVLDSVDSGIVATRGVRGVAWAIRMCERMLENDRLIRRVQWIMTFAGALGAAALTYAGLIDATVSVIAALLIVIFCLPSLMLAGRNLWIDAVSQSNTTTVERVSKTLRDTKAK